MKYIFFGTPRFAEIILDGLIHAGMPPAALVCNPDRPVGRKKIVTPPPTKILAAKKAPQVEILQPEKIDEATLQQLSTFKPDFFVVAAYAKILPKIVLDIPRLGTLGVHPSLLPEYRGASPIQSAILNGAAKTGATIYLMDEKTDHGPILRQEICNVQCAISELPYTELEEVLAKLSAELLIKTIPDFTAGKLVPRSQDEARATYTKKFTAQDGFVDEAELAAATSGGDGRSEKEKTESIFRKINALDPEPGAWTMRDGKRIKLLKAKLDRNRLILLETQKEGERAKPSA